MGGVLMGGARSRLSAEARKAKRLAKLAAEPEDVKNLRSDLAQTLESYLEGKMECKSQYPGRRNAAARKECLDTEKMLYKRTQAEEKAALKAAIAKYPRLRKEIAKARKSSIACKAPIRGVSANDLEDLLERLRLADSPDLMERLAA